MSKTVNADKASVKKLTTDEAANAKDIGTLKTATKDIGDIKTLTADAKKNTGDVKALTTEQDKLKKQQATDIHDIGTLNK